jgi:Asp-tRNA(Asn)/Glu-tRNA(Gln) amidotransferase A subunit family amidase
VAVRLSPLELGSDIGGSVRNPAHYNDIFSLKPTEWHVPGLGVAMCLTTSSVVASPFSTAMVPG